MVQRTRADDHVVRRHGLPIEHVTRAEDSSSVCTASMRHIALVDIHAVEAQVTPYLSNFAEKVAGPAHHVQEPPVGGCQRDSLPQDGRKRLAVRPKDEAPVVDFDLGQWFHFLYSPNR